MLDSIAFWVIKFYAWFIQRLPYRAATGLGSVVGFLAFLLDRHKEYAYVNLKAAFGREMPTRQIRKIARGTYFNLARTGIEILRFPITDKTFLDQYLKRQDHNEFLRDAQGKKKGVIITTAHIGNWELGQVVLRLQGFPMYLVARSQPHTKLNQLLNAYRGIFGSRIVPQGMSLRDVWRALGRGEIVAMVPDQSGGEDGTYTRFFGRLTSFPIGAFKLARRTGASLLPCFLVHGRSGTLEIYSGQAREVNPDEDEYSALQRDLEHYVRELERIIRKFPEQWLWVHKRWKYTRTKIIAVLIDEKAGHTVQARAVLDVVKKAYEKRDPLAEVIVEEIPVRFKSSLHRYLAYGLTFFLLPWLRGRLGWVTWTLKKPSAEKVESQYADVVISCGSPLLPIEAALARENRARKIVMMKPSFPYSLLRYDIALIPEHDRPTQVKESFFVDLAPSLVNTDSLSKAGARLRGELGIPTDKYVTLLIGGDTKNYEMDVVKMDFAFREIRRAAEHMRAKILITTSRRTHKRVEELVRKYFDKKTICSLAVIANEKNYEGVVYGMIDLAEVIVVTEDSISMISESIQSGKPVIVLQAARYGVRPKYERFQQIVRLRNYAVICHNTDIARHIEAFLDRKQTLSPCQDRGRMTERLAGAL